MFGVGSLFHRLAWEPRGEVWMGRVDHAMIYALIAGTYAPIGLLVVHPELAGADPRDRVGRCVDRNAGEGGLAEGAALDRTGYLRRARLARVVVLPQIVDRIGVPASLLLVGGGLVYTAGAVVYARQAAGPEAATFGYHEIFHALVFVAVACQYAAVAFFVLPQA